MESTVNYLGFGGLIHGDLYTYNPSQITLVYSVWARSQGMSRYEKHWSILSGTCAAWGRQLVVVMFGGKPFMTLILMAV